jgi:hypothetical protein
MLLWGKVLGGTTVATKLSGLLVLAALIVAVFAFPVFAQISTIDYTGFAWETNGGLKAVGDEFHFVGAANHLDAIFGIDLTVDELTFHVYGLLSTGDIDVGGGVIMVTYTGGFMEIYQDSSQNADWGINPPNPTVPATFADGDLFFSGAFTDMTMFFTPDGGGSFAGNLNGLSGSAIDASCTGCVYTWGGAFSVDAGAQIPEGYAYQVVGALEIDEAVTVDESSWGSVKALYSN